MKKYITKTAREIEFEKNNKMQDNSCPDCGYKYNFGIQSIEDGGGFFKIKRRKIFKYTCFECGCEYVVEGDWEKF
jgi:hypothetical protein